MSSDLLPDPNPQPVSGTVTANAGTNLNTSALALETTQAAAAVLTGAVGETAPASDTASSGLNGRLQRIAQRLTSLIAVFNIGAGTEAAAVRVTLPTDGTGKVNAAQSGTWTVQPGNTANTTAWKVDGSAVTQPVSGTVAVTGVATETTQAAGNVLTGAVNETAPASDTASSGLNGRLQRIAQRLTSLIALLPAALGAGGGIKVDGSGTALPVSGTVTATVGTVTAVTTITNVVHVDDNAGSLTVDGTVDITEIPAAAALADGAANPTTTTVGAANLAFNGTTNDRIRTIDAFVTASTTPTVGIVAALAPDRRYTSVNLGATVGNTQSWDLDGADMVIVYVGTTQTGTFTFEVSADGTNYVPAETRDTQLDLWVGGTNLTPTANKTYRIVTNGYRSLRARTVTTLGAVVAMTATLAAHSTILNAIDTGPAPHAIGYAFNSKTAQYATAQTGVALWTPASGRRVVVTEVQIQVGGTVGGTVQLWYGGSADTTYTRGTDRAIFDGEFAPSATNKPGAVMHGCWPAAAIDDVLRVTNTGTINPLTVTCWGYETP